MSFLSTLLAFIASIFNVRAMRNGGLYFLTLGRINLCFSVSRQLKLTERQVENELEFEVESIIWALVFWPVAALAAFLTASLYVEPVIRLLRWAVAAG